MMMQTKHVSKPNIYNNIFKRNLQSLLSNPNRIIKITHAWNKTKKTKKELTSTEVVENDNNK